MLHGSTKISRSTVVFNSDNKKYFSSSKL